MTLIAGGKGYLCCCRPPDRLQCHEAQEEVKRIPCAFLMPSYLDDCVNFGQIVAHVYLCVVQDLKGINHLKM